MTNLTDFGARRRKHRGIQFSQITLEQLILDQQNDAFCPEIKLEIDAEGRPPFRTDHNGIIVKTANPNEQIAISYQLKELVLDLSHYPVLESHPSGRKL